MDTISEQLDKLVELLNKLYGLPAIALVGILCLTTGYMLKANRWFPNKAIPLVVVLMGGALLPLMSDWMASRLPFRIWLVRNLALGLIVGTAAWVFHKVVLKKVEEKIPWLGKLFYTNNDKPDDGD